MSKMRRPASTQALSLTCPAAGQPIEDRKRKGFMVTSTAEQAVDVVPFAARGFWSTPVDYEIWWEDPRDFFRVVVNLAVTGPDAPAPILSYWRSSWPHTRIPKGALVGAGDSGWMNNDDWTTGVWQVADCIVEQEVEVLTYKFHPLNTLEFPQETDFSVVFRRTLKLKLTFAEPGARVVAVAACTDSTWCEEEITIQWKQPGLGRVEAFNGAVLSVRRLGVSDESLSGVIARLRYAANGDPNSFDRTIVTLYATGLYPDLPGVSFYLTEALGPEPIYLRDLGILIHPARQPLDFAAFEKMWEANHSLTLFDQIHQLPEQTWERAWANMPPKVTRMYYTLGCEGSRQKFAVESDGSIFMTDTYIRQVPGRDSARLGWKGHKLRLRLGPPERKPADRSILEGDLPILRTEWVDAGLAISQEVFAAWLWGESPTERRPGDDPVILMVRVAFTNLTMEAGEINLPIQSIVDDKDAETLACRDGWITTRGGQLRMRVEINGQGEMIERSPEEMCYRLHLPPGSAHAIFLKIAQIDLSDPEEKARLVSLDYTYLRQCATAAWRERIDQSTRIRTPNETINSFYRTHLMHMLVINDREPGADRNVARCGGFYYGSFPDEGCMAILDLDRRGLHKEAERCLELYVHYQGSVPLPGNFNSSEGVFFGSGGYEEAGYNRNHGWVLWTLTEHYRFTRDRAWLERIAPALVKGCDWILRERQATMVDNPIQYGFLPSGSLEDVTDYWTWLATNIYAGWGFLAAAGVLAEIEHPEAGRLAPEAQAFWSDLRAGFFAACARSPVVRLRDSTWVPHFPTRQERRGRDLGWLREVLEGACHLIYCGLIRPDEPAAAWILKDYEDNLFLSAQYGYRVEDFERQWFDLGGFSMQSNLLLFPPLYLQRDEPKHYLRGYFNAFTSAFFPDTVTMCEHALPDLAHWRGDHFKSSDEANSNGWLRGMFLAEYGQDLFIGQAIPRAWFEHGKKMEIERAATHFGETSVVFISHVATGSITAHLELPQRNPPQRILLRLRHPEQHPMKVVWVNGLPHSDFDPIKEVIYLKHHSDPVEVRALY